MFNRSHTKRDEEKFYQLFECSPLGISLTQLNGKLKVNKAFYKLLEYTEPELSNKHWKSITYKDDILVSEKIIKQLLSGEKETAIFEKRYIKKSGDLIWVKLTSTLQKDKKGNAISFINIVSEINDQTMNEIETSKNGNISYNLFEYSQDALFIINKDTAQIVDVNQATINLYGYSKDELLKMKSMDVSAQPEETKNALDKSLKRVSDRIHKRKDGSLFPVDVTASYYEQAGKNYSLVSVRDITQQKEFENRIKQNELRYKELFECNPQPMWLYDLSTLKFLMVNEMAVKKYGYSKEEFNRMTIMDIRPEEDIPLLMNHIKQMDKPYGLSSNWKHKLKDGSVIDVDITSHEIKLNGWKARVVQAMDITERRAAQIKLIKEHAKLNAIIECTDDIIFSVDKDYCYTSFNTNHAAKMKEIYLADIKIGQCVLNYQTEEDRIKAKKNLDRALKGERVEEISTSGKKEIKQLYFQIVHNPIRDDSDEIIGVSVFAKDITESTKALQELKNKEEELRTLFNEDLTGDYISTIEGKIVLCNKKFREIYGFENEDEVSSFDTNLLYKNPADRIEMIKRISEQKKLENFELVMVRKDGTQIQILENVVGKFDEDGKLVRLMGYVLDITKQKQANEKVQQLSRAVEQSPLTILITDTVGNIKYINQKGLELTGYDRSEIIDQNPRIFSSKEKSKEDYAVMWDTIKSGQEWSGEFHNRKKNGELYWESASISSIKNEKDEIINFLAVKEDITTRKKWEQELIIAKEKAEEMNRIKTNFFSNMSHELRTPLSGILGFSELLSEEINDAEHKRMIDAINLNGQRLHETLNRILQISKIESQKLEVNIEALNVVEFISNLLPEFEGSLIKKNLFIKFNTKSNYLFANLDGSLFRTIIDNLISNAIKFTRTGGIIINCRDQSNNGRDYVLIEISDTGIGISDSDIKNIFDEFRQASEGLSRNFEGTGLGLTIAKKYTELQDGRISVESTVGKGSKFILEFPRLHFTQDQQLAISFNDEETQPKIALDKKKPLVLLVEDDFLNTHLIKKFLVDVCILHSIQNGEEAIELVKVNNYDAILMDIGLGKGMNGLETTRIIREIPRYKETPIIAITAYAMNGDKAKFLSSGLTGYISKPFKMNELVNVLGRALNLI